MAAASERAGGGRVCVFDSAGRSAEVRDLTRRLNGLVSRARSSASMSGAKKRSSLDLRGGEEKVAGGYEKACFVYLFV